VNIYFCYVIYFRNYVPVWSLLCIKHLNSLTLSSSPPVFSGAIPNIWSFEPEPLTTAVMSSEERSTSFPHAEMSGRPSRHRRTPKHLEEYLLDYSHHRPALSSSPTAEVPVEQRGAAAAVGIFSQSRPDSSQGEHPATSSTDLLSMSSLRELSLRRKEMKLLTWLHFKANSSSMKNDSIGVKS